MKTQRGNVSIIVSVVIAVVLIGFVIYAVIHAAAPAPTTPVADQPVITAPTTPPTDTQAVVPPTNSMDQVAKDGDTLVMNYTGRLENGTVFDSNVDPKFGHVQPFTFVLGAGQVIKGWDEGLVGMKVGEKKTLTIAPQDGYGAAGAPPAIPPNATLIFDVELVAIK